MKKNEFEKLESEMLLKKYDVNLFGDMETLKGTDNLYWYAFSKKLSITIKSLKRTDIIINMWNFKKKVTPQMLRKDEIKLEDLMKKVKISSCLTLWQKIKIEVLSTIKALIYLPVYYKDFKVTQK